MFPEIAQSFSPLAVKTDKVANNYVILVKPFHIGDKIQRLFIFKAIIDVREINGFVSHLKEVRESNSDL